MVQGVQGRWWKAWKQFRVWWCFPESWICGGARCRNTRVLAWAYWRQSLIGPCQVSVCLKSAMYCLFFFYPRILSKSVSFRIRLNAEASSHANCVSCGLSMAIVRLLISPIVFNVFVMADLFYCSRNNCRPCQYDNVCWVIEKYGLVTVYSKMLQWSQRTTPNL